MLRFWRRPTETLTARPAYRLDEPSQCGSEPISVPALTMQLTKHYKATEYGNHVRNGQWPRCERQERLTSLVSGVRLRSALSRHTRRGTDGRLDEHFLEDKQGTPSREPRTSWKSYRGPVQRAVSFFPWRSFGSSWRCEG